MVQSPEDLIGIALGIAASGSSQDLPIAAIITDGSGSTIALSRNAVIKKGDVTAHAELEAIRMLSLPILKRDAKRMTVAVTLEPCPMCAWAIRSAGFGRLIFGAYNNLYGAAGSVYDLLRDQRHSRVVEVIGGVLEAQCQVLLDNAFADIRNNDDR